MKNYQVKVLGTTGYTGKRNGQYGDCFILYNEAKKKIVVYDCGSEQHAEKVIELMNSKGITKTDIILSHNDLDHFEGIPKLIEEKKVGKIFTTLLLKYVDDILEKLDDDRRTREATKKRILELYDNIATLSGCDLKDIYEDSDELPDGLSCIGPDFDTMITAVSKAVKKDDTSVTIDNETVVNSTSLQISVPVQGGKKLLLLGDTSVSNVTCSLKEYRYVHLPHHGKLASAEAIFDKIDTEDDGNSGIHTYIVSDNTGTTNGGSDDLMKSTLLIKGKNIRNTKTAGTIPLGVTVHVNVDSAREQYGLCFGS